MLVIQDPLFRAIADFEDLGSNEGKTTIKPNSDSRIHLRHPGSITELHPVEATSESGDLE